jgi:hypothetical protein
VAQPKPASPPHIAPAGPSFEGVGAGLTVAGALGEPLGAAEGSGAGVLGGGAPVVQATTEPAKSQALRIERIRMG